MRDGAPVYAAGVARLRLLLNDPCSPARAGDDARRPPGARAPRGFMSHLKGEIARQRELRVAPSSCQSVSDRSTS